MAVNLTSHERERIDKMAADIAASYARTLEGATSALGKTLKSMLDTWPYYAVKTRKDHDARNTS